MVNDDDIEMKAAILQTQALVAQRVLRAMELRGVKQAELARRMGVPDSYLSRALSGGQNLTVKTLTRIARALGMRLDIVLSGV